MAAEIRFCDVHESVTVPPGATDDADAASVQAGVCGFVVVTVTGAEQVTVCPFVPTAVSV